MVTAKVPYSHLSGKKENAAEYFHLPAGTRGAPISSSPVDRLDYPAFAPEFAGFSAWTPCCTACATVALGAIMNGNG